MSLNHGEIRFNGYITADSSSRYWLYYANRFDTSAATLITDYNGISISGSSSGLTAQTFTFNYETLLDTDYVAVSIGLNNSQYIRSDGTLVNSDINIINLVANQELNYSVLSGVSWSNIYNKPTTVAGYGIVDVYSGVNYIDFNSTESSAQAGRVYFDTSENALSYYPQTDAMDVTINLGQETVLRIYNNTGVQINNGQICHASGSYLGATTVELADAADLSGGTATISGVATHNIPNGEYGFITRFGLVRDLNTGTALAGDPLYLSDTVKGGWVNNINTLRNSSRICYVGRVISTGVTNGTILVNYNNENPLGTTASNAQAYTLSLNDSSTGVREGGVLSRYSEDNTKFNISSGCGYILDNGNPDNPSLKIVTWIQQTAVTLIYLTAETATFICIDEYGALHQHPNSSFPTSEEKRKFIYVGFMTHALQVVSTIVNQPISVVNPLNHLEDLTYSIGSFPINGNLITAGAGLTLNKSAGDIYSFGGNVHNNIYSPSIFNSPILTAATLYYQMSTRILGASGNTISTSSYDNNGVLTTIPNSERWVAHRIYHVPSENRLLFQYGQAVYKSSSIAVSTFASENFIVPSPVLQIAYLTCVVVIEKGATDLSNAILIKQNKFASSAGANAYTTLQVAYDNSVTPEILTDSTRSAMTFRVGSDMLNVDNLVEFQTYTGITTAWIKGDGTAMFNSVTANTIYTGNVGSNLIPSANGIYDLGDSTHFWRDLYLSGGTLYMENIPIDLRGTDLYVNNSLIAKDSNAMHLTGDETAYGTKFFMSNIKIDGVYHNPNTGTTLTTTSGLTLWLAADSGTTKDGSDYILQWNDISNNGHNVVQDTGNVQWVDSQLNGRPVLRFNGSSYFSGLTIDGINNSSFSFFAVASCESTSSSREEGIFSIGSYINGLWIERFTHATGDARENAFGFYNTTGNILYSGEDTIPLAGCSAKIFYVEKSLNSYMSIYFNGIQMATQPGYGVAFTNGNFLIGKSGEGAWKGDVAEILMFNRVLTSDERIAVESYLNTKYTIYNPTPDPLIYAGIEIYRGASLPSYVMHYDSGSTTFRIGPSGNTNKIATIEDSPSNSAFTYYLGNKLMTNTAITLFNNTVTISGYYNQTQTNANFLSANTSYYSQSQVNNLLSVSGANYVHLTGDETIYGTKFFMSNIKIDGVYHNPNTGGTLSVTSGMTLWLKADTGVTYDGSNKVSAWADMSGNGNNASQSTEGYKPIYVSGQLNDKPVLRFDENNITHMTIDTFLGVKSLFVVANWSGTASFSNYNSIIDRKTYTGEAWNYLFLATVGTTDLLSIGLFTTDIYVNGTNTLSFLPMSSYKVVSGIKSNSYTFDLSIGSSFSSGGRDWTGDIAEVIVYDRVLTSDERSLVETYLNNKYLLYNQPPDPLIYAGIEIYRGGTLSNYVMHYDSGSTTFRIGPSGLTNKIATIEDSPSNSAFTYYLGNKLVTNTAITLFNNTVTISGYYNQSQSNSNFLSANTSYYTQGQTNTNFLSANTSYYTQAQSNANFLSANTTTFSTIRSSFYRSNDTNFFLTNTTVAVGYTGTENIIMGNADNGKYLASGAYNVGIGYMAGGRIIDGNRNVHIGYYAGYTSGYYASSNDNIAIGNSAMADQVNTGAYNVAIGHSALRNLSAGSNNIGIGYYAGMYLGTQSHNIILGTYDRTNTAGDIANSPIYISELDQASATTMRLNVGDLILQYLPSTTATTFEHIVIDGNGKLYKLTI